MLAHAQRQAKASFSSRYRSADSVSVGGFAIERKAICGFQLESGKPDQPVGGQLVVHNPHSHLEFTANGAVLISNDINTTQSADLIYADNYRPKFVRVPIAGIE
jgi:hypothetical protein